MIEERKYLCAFSCEFIVKANHEGIGAEEYMIITFYREFMQEKRAAVAEMAYHEPHWEFTETPWVDKWLSTR